MRFFFLTREESRPRIHVIHPGREAKFWLEPAIEIADNHGLGPRHLAQAKQLIREHQDEIRRAWQEQFSS
jgi:hypothetical protein